MQEIRRKDEGMGNRLLCGRGPARKKGEFLWFSSGVLTVHTVIKEQSGVLGWVCVHALDSGGDIEVKIWDSPDGVLTDDTVVLSHVMVTIPRKGTGRHPVFPLPGIEAVSGIYLEVVSGDCEVIVGYK